MIAQRTIFRRLTVILCLMVTCAGLAILAPGRAQEGTPTPLYVRVLANDAAGLALAIQTANSVPEAATHIYLEGGSYAFSADGLVLPPFRGHFTVYGNQATLRLDRTPLVIDEEGQVELRHLNLSWGGGQERGIFNEGVLSLRDSSLSADESLTDEGGGILNRGQLTLERVSLHSLRRTSSSEPGGAVYNGGILNAHCTAFRNNHASQGGAIHNADGGISTVSDSVFEGNSANGGGAIFNADAHPVQALNNFWGGGAPLVEDLYRSTDTISSGVLVYPFQSTNPLELPGCATPPPDPIPAGAILSSCTSGGLTTPQPLVGGTLPSAPSPSICLGSLPTAPSNVPAAATTVVVTRIDDRNATCSSGDCSLREAIRTAPNGAVITFDAAISGPIVLTQPIRITGKTLTLQGRPHQPTIISGNDQFNLFILNESNTQWVSLTLEYLTLTRGRAVTPNNGGAIYARDSFIIIRNSTLHHNRSTQNGGALYTEASTVYLTNVTLANNIAGTWGGAINNNRGMYTLTNTTIIDNQALGGAGGGVYSFVPVQQAVIHLYNSLIARNTPGGNCTGDVFGDYNVVTIDGGDRYSPCGQYGTHNREVTRAQLGVQEAGGGTALRDNGGPTLTVAILSPTSPLIDAADPNRCPLTDQRGVARVGLCDMGGVEYTLAQATPTPTLSNTLITVYTNCGTRNLRSDHSMSADLVGEVPAGVPIYLDPSSKATAGGFDWYRVRVNGTIPDGNNGYVTNPEGWIAAKSGNFYYLFDYDRSPNCNLTPTAIMTQTPRPTTCQLTAVNQKIHFFRAPIRGNPAEAKETAGNPDLKIDAYAIDPLNHRLWFRRTEGVPQAPNGFILRWFQVIEPTAGFILPQEGIIVPKEDFDGVQSLTMARDQIEACLSTLISANLSGHYALPALDQVPWELTSPLTFSHYPVSMYQTCVASNTPHTMPHISGFADAKGYFDPGYHFGVDFFAPVGSAAFAGAGGLVVALIHSDEMTGTYWGNYKPDEITNNFSPFAVVIRYGHLFAVYGHLMTVDPNIWVGKYVEAGTRLGTVGTWNTPHLHLSVMSFGRTSPDAYITWAQEVDPQSLQVRRANRWGIADSRANGGPKVSYPGHVYDFTQFFEPNPVLLATFQATVTATGTPNTLEQPIHRSSIWAEDNATVTLMTDGLGGKDQTILKLGFPCERSYSQSFPEPTGWRYVNPIITPTTLPRHRSFIYFPGVRPRYVPVPADDPRVAIPAPNLAPLPTLTPTATP